MSIDPLSRDIGSPLYHQVYHILRSGILSGRYGSGSFLAAEGTLAANFAVSRVTVRRAMQALESEGLIERQQGRGTRVSYDGAVRPSVFSGGVQKVSLPLAPSKLELVSFEIIPASVEVAQSLEIDVGKLVYHIQRLRRRDGLPVMAVANFVPKAVAPNLTVDDLADLPIADALQHQGVECRRAEDEYGAILADHAIASMLDIKVGSAILTVGRILRDQNRIPLTTQQTLIPPERDTIRMVIEASSANAISQVETPVTLIAR